MTGALTWARLSYRQQRWELILVVLAVAGLGAGRATTLVAGVAAAVVQRRRPE